MKTVGITGGTGFTGKHIARLLADAGNKVIVFSRKSRQGKGDISHAVWQPDEGQIDTKALSKCDAVINLAGAGVADHRWTTAYKEEIIRSRVAATRFLIGQLREHAPKCRTFVAASATGYYGPDEAGSPPFTEEAPAYPDFLGEVCREWEEASREAAPYFRTVILRLGIVLGREGGAYPKLAQPTRFGLLPIIGGGAQVVSWIHVVDLARLFCEAVLDERWEGVYNAVSPQPVTHRELMQTIGKVKGGLKIPAPVPGFVLRMIMGESSVEVLKSTTVSAKKVQREGFAFLYPDIESAVTNLEKGEEAQ